MFTGNFTDDGCLICGKEANEVKIKKPKFVGAVCITHLKQLHKRNEVSKGQRDQIADATQK
ncbi:MAG: hypothetical protein KDA86_25505 [Planctomycetaceae bacterium]|nr:hypothetical protein [Planctomycetaceae bacterium]